METRVDDELFGFPLSCGQRRLWFLDQLFPATPLYNLPLVLHLTVPVDAAVLERCLQEMSRRHEALRTTFRTVAGEPVQVVNAGVDLRLRSVALDHLPAVDREAAAITYAAEELRRPFDLTVGPLWRATLVRLAPADHFLLLTTHHIVSDGWSMGLMLQELQALYTAFAAGLDSPLPEPPLQYVDYAIWQHEALSSDVMASQLAYWLGVLEDLPTIELPSVRPRPPTPTLRGRRHYFAFSAEVSRAIDDLAQQESATPFMALLAAYALLLHHCTGESDIPVGTPIAGRSRTELEPLIGFFVNTLVLRVDLGGNPTFRELIRRVRARALEAYTNQDLPFEKLVEELQPSRDLSRSPLFQVMFAMQNAPTAGQEREGTAVRSVEIESGTTTVDLALDVWRRRDCYAARFEYNLDLFDDDAVRQLAEQFTALLDGITRAPDRRLSDCRAAGTPDVDARVGSFLEVDAAEGDYTVVARIAESLAEHPDTDAVISEQGAVSRALLVGRARALASVLRNRGIAAERPVAVLLDRSPDVLVTMLGTWWAGGAYVPLDPRDPPLRLGEVLKDIAPGAIVTTTSHAALVHDLAPTASDVIGHTPRIVLVDALLPENVEDAEVAEAAPADLAYVIYTSGSAGTPRGVAVEHRALANHLGWMQSLFPLAPGDRVLQTTHLGFDVSLWELVAPLAAGATVVLPPPGAEAEPARVVALLAQHDITAFQTTPSFLRLMLDVAAFRGCDALRWVFCGAEPMPRDLAESFRMQGPDATLCNMYGPTESTIDAAFYPYPRHGAPPDTRSGTVPIGRAVANLRLHVLDAWGQPVPPGAAGELYISGRSLARGYWNDPRATAERFVPDPFAGTGKPMYRTGDRVRVLPTGDIELLGRIDRQLKIRGVRIEPAEIERVLSTHPGVREAYVAPGTTVRGALGLVAYLAFDRAATDGADLRTFLETRLPRSMVPAAFVLLERLPRTARGKIDVTALARIPVGTPGSEHAHVAPRTEIERAIVSIWQALLSLDRVGVADNFFELGGHSLLATQLVSRVLDQFGVTVPLRVFFEDPTVAGLALLIDTARRDRPASVDERIDVEAMALGPDGVDRLSDHEVAQLLRAMLDREAFG